MLLNVYWSNVIFIIISDIEEMKTKLFLPNYKPKSVTKQQYIQKQQHLPKLISKLNMIDLSNLSAIDNSFCIENKKINQSAVKKKKKIYFKKVVNKIESNIYLHGERENNSKKQNFIEAKTCSSSFYKAKHSSSSFYDSTFVDTIKPSVKQMNITFFPRTFQEITNKYQAKFSNKKYKIFNRSFGLAGFQNKQKQQLKCSKQIYQLPKFNVFQLKSYYNSILIYADSDFNKFKYAFQIMLSLCSVTVRQNILNQCLQDLKKDLTFKNFIKAFAQIQQRVRKQAIIDYFQILLEQNKQKDITYEELVSTFETRMKKNIANQLTELIFETLGRDFGNIISKQHIYNLCYENQGFCNAFHVLNRRNVFNQKRIP